MDFFLILLGAVEFALPFPSGFLWFLLIRICAYKLLFKNKSLQFWLFSFGFCFSPSLHLPTKCSNCLPTVGLNKDELMPEIVLQDILFQFNCDHSVSMLLLRVVDSFLIGNGGFLHFRPGIHWLSPGTGVEGVAFKPRQRMTQDPGAIMGWAGTSPSAAPAALSSDTEFTQTPTKVQNVQLQPPGTLFFPEDDCSHIPGPAVSASWVRFVTVLAVRIWPRAGTLVSCVLCPFWSTGPSKGFIPDHPRWSGVCATGNSLKSANIVCPTSKMCGKSYCAMWCPSATAASGSQIFPWRNSSLTWLHQIQALPGAGNLPEGASGSIPVFAAVTSRTEPNSAALEPQGHRNTAQAAGMHSLLGWQPRAPRAAGKHFILTGNLGNERIYHLELVVVDMTSTAPVQTINWAAAAAANSQRGVRERSSGEALPGFEKKKGVSKGEKQLEGKSKFRNRSPCLIR